MHSFPSIAMKFTTWRVALRPILFPGRIHIIRIGKRNKPPGLGYLMDAVPLYSALRRIKPHVIYQRVGCGYTGIPGSTPAATVHD